MGDHMKKFQEAKQHLAPTHRAAVEKAEKAGAKHGPRAAVRQTLRNTHDMVNEIEDALNDATTDDSLRAVLDTGIKAFEDGITFIKEHKEALLTQK